MLDRHGRPIRVGWPEHHLIWLRAAMTLEPHEMREAFQDIAELTGRSYACVYAQKCLLERQDRIDQKRKRLADYAARYVDGVTMCKTDRIA